MSELEQDNEYERLGYARAETQLGFKYVNDQGRTMYEYQNYKEGGDQHIKFEHGQPLKEAGPDGSPIVPWKEIGQLKKIKNGQETSETQTREQPLTVHQVDVRGTGKDGESIQGTIVGRLTAFGEGFDSQGERIDHWLKLEETNRSTLERMFRGIEPVKSGCKVIEAGAGQHLDAYTLNVNGRLLEVSLTKISIDFDDQGKPVKATFRHHDWREKA